MKKGARRYFLFENSFEHIFKTILSFKSLKNTFFRVFKRWFRAPSLGPPNRAPKYMIAFILTLTVAPKTAVSRRQIILLRATLHFFKRMILQNGFQIRKVRENRSPKHISLCTLGVVTTKNILDFSSHG